MTSENNALNTNRCQTQTRKANSGGGVCECNLSQQQEK
jgi:hypothetical protein